MLDVWNNYKIF